ncbi:7,8-epoxymelianol synthase CYP88A154 [Elaeis guineensis]|uniref:Ent-kaurenoic acid oxidase 2 n=1 Tax=Elaeis guineensis var. tenera TaxID=51953 RepID=A0A6I9RG58_ELAGV|nr:ent-kaurenoic acid oxidase 2 [Elaeis guineensis]
MEEAVRASGVAIAVGVVVLSFIAWFARWLQDRRFVRGIERDPGSARLPPGSMGWPLIGEMFDFLRCFKFSGRPDDFIARRKERYGETGIYRSHLFGHPVIVTCSPDLNKQVLGSLTEEGTFSTGWPSSQLLGNSVANIDGTLHKRIRKHLMKAFNSPRALDSHLSTAQPIFNSTLEDWVSKKKIVAYDETKIMTFRNICDVLVSLKSPALLDTMEPLYRGLMAGLRSTTINIPGTAFHHALKCKKKLSSILSDELKKRKEQGVQKHDFMQILIDSVDDNGNKLSEVEIVDNILSLILGGHESTSNVMTWGLYYLAKYPEILEKLKEETFSIRTGKALDDLLTTEDIKSMKYASKVAEELIRLTNLPPFIFRRVVKDAVLNGYKFPKNWKVLVWIRSIHIDPKYYDDPLAFNPDRWNNFMPKPGVYSVFGGGPRYCPGSNFARLQVMMFLHHVCLKYRWELLNPESGIAFDPHPRPRDGAELLFSRAS